MMKHNGFPDYKVLPWEQRIAVLLAVNNKNNHTHIGFTMPIPAHTKIPFLQVFFFTFCVLQTLGQ